MKKIIKENTIIFLLLSLTLGLAPFTPEPHLWGKIKWILGGANGMTLLDYFDFIFHGLPWILLITSIYYRFTGSKK